MVVTEPMFPEPAEQPVTLSETLTSSDLRLGAGQRAKWTEVNLKTYRPCKECAYVQHETHGRFRPRRQVRHRRRHPNGKTLDLCHAHSTLWRDRDRVDSGELPT
jgi:hypothetical protein